MLGRHRRPPAAADGPGQRAGAGHDPRRRSSGTACWSPADAGRGSALSDESRARSLPLGGLGEIGKNMTVVEHDGRIVVVDTGLMFPTAEMLGIDLVLPDFSYLRERADDIEAIVLTHGHEDHVGALPYVLREIGMPPVIYGGPLTIGLVRSKLEEHRLRDAPARGARGRRAGRRRARSSSSWSTCRTRSRTRARSRCDTELGARAGHRRLQVRPDAGRRAARPTSRGSPSWAARACCACSATRPTPTGPAWRRRSRASGPALLETFSRCEGRIIVTCFASNVHRVQQVIDAAARARPHGWRWSAARCARTSTSPPTSGSPRLPTAC